MTDLPPRRFLTLDDVADELNTTRAQVYALVRGGDVAAIKVGGRGVWRVERSALEDFIARCYSDTKQFVSEHRFDPKAEPVAGE